MLVELVRTTTSDGLRLDGALHAQHPGDAPACDLAICLHGVQSNFYSSSLIEALVAPLLSQGIDVLRVNTRGHDSVAPASSQFGRRWQGAAHERIDECRLDVQAWLAWAQERGYRHRLLLGHSLGALKCCYAAAHESLTHVRAIVAISPPRLSYTAFQAAPDNGKYRASLETAQRLMAANQPDALFEASFPVPLLITAAGYLDKYGPGERYNYLQFLHRISPPALVTFGARELRDSAAFAGAPDAIATAMSGEGGPQVVTIDHADHFYTGQHAALGGAIVDWLKARALVRPPR